jgi:hypothetical protein
MGRGKSPGNQRRHVSAHFAPIPGECPAVTAYYGVWRRNGRHAGGGTRTPDTRIMIPLVIPVFTSDSGVFGRQIGLFCQGTCTTRTDSCPRFQGDSGLRRLALRRGSRGAHSRHGADVVRENRVDRAGIAQLDRGRQMDGVESADLRRFEPRGVLQEPCRQRLEHDRGGQLFSLDLEPCALFRADAARPRGGRLIANPRSDRAPLGSRWRQPHREAADRAPKYRRRCQPLSTAARDRPEGTDRWCPRDAASPWR